jgi:hypothetical protein
MMPSVSRAYGNISVLRACGNILWDAWWMNWIGFGWKQLWAKRVFILLHLGGETEENHRNPQFRKQVPSHDSDQVPAEYESNLLTYLLVNFIIKEQKSISNCITKLYSLYVV